MDIHSFSQYPFFLPLLGGIIIGTACGLLFLTIGRLAGVSGIAGGLLENMLAPDMAGKKRSAAHFLLWRFLFVLGLVIGGLIMNQFTPFIAKASPASFMTLIVSGVLVGVGTRLGQGCTSGHGVCGIGRFSITSIVSTVIFIVSGILTVAVIRQLLEEFSFLKGIV